MGNCGRVLILVEGFQGFTGKNYYHVAKVFAEKF